MNTDKTKPVIHVFFLSVFICGGIDVRLRDWYPK
jgi:hypothetical protein